VPKALRLAREHARHTDVKASFVEGSTAALTTLGVGSGFRRILDVGTVHARPPDQVRPVRRAVTAVSTADASLLMYAFSPGRRGPLPRGIDREEIARAYEEWTIIDEEAFEVAGAP
jgi:hypothetical protein